MLSFEESCSTGSIEGVCRVCTSTSQDVGVREQVGEREMRGSINPVGILVS